jgi:hypothetical protein
MGNEVPGGMEAQHCHNYNNDNIENIDRKLVKMCVCSGRVEKIKRGHSAQQRGPTSVQKAMMHRV